MTDTFFPDHLSRGRHFYKIKDYPAALYEFTQAIDEGSESMKLQALDHRAATYEKLDDFPLALKDARVLMKLRPQLTLGYLRAGKVLQLQSKDELAMTIYEIGLKRVPVGKDENRMLLQGMFSAIQKKLPKKQEDAYDPLEKLPVEIADLICSYLAMRDRVICLCVSKSWKNILESNYKLWMELDTVNIKKRLKITSLRAYCRRSNYRLTKARIDLRRFDPSNLPFLIKKCERLEYLDFHHGFLGDSLIESLPNAKNLQTLKIEPSVEGLSMVQLPEILALQPKLEMVAFGRVSAPQVMQMATWPRMEALTSLEISGIPQRINYQDNWYGDIVVNTPNLTRLRLGHLHFGFMSIPDFSAWVQLESLTISDCYGYGLDGGIELGLLPQSIKHLYISSALGLSSKWKDPEWHGTRLPLLESLVIRNSHAIVMEQIGWLIETSAQAGNLRILDIGPMDPSNVVFPECGGVTTLSISCWTIDEGGLLKFIDFFPNVKRLDVSRTYATGVLVEKVMTREGGPLEFLDVSQTKTSSDAVEWARSLGTTVRWVNSSESRPKSFRDRLWG